MTNNLAPSKYRRSTSYTLSFPTLPTLETAPRRVEIHQKPYHHDVLIMEFSNVSPKWFGLMKTGVPIKFSWSQGSVTNYWLGYVSFVTKNVAGQIEELMEVHCVGSTFPLKERATKVFADLSIPDAVKQVVTEFGFNFIGDDNGVVFDQLTIAGHSYWEWIVENAKKIGYGVWVDKMDFYFRPIDKLIDQGLASIPVLGMNSKQFGINNQFLDRTLDSFKVLSGEFIEGLGTSRTIKKKGAVDPITSEVLLSESSPKDVGNKIKATVNDVLFSEVESSQVSYSSETIASLSEGAAQLARLNMPARIKCQGDPRIHPFAPILLESTGTLTDGYWISSEVKHMFARIGDYQIEMKANIDGTGLDARTVTKDGAKYASGVVNLNHALEVGFAGQKVLRSTLKLQSNFIKEDNQGYKRTPAVWWHDANGGK